MVVTKKDMELLRAVIEIHSLGGDAEAAARLSDQLDRASIVPSEHVPVDVVTMNSRVVFEDHTGARREVLLVYPPAADESRDRVSVLSPVGTALLGLVVGESIDWPVGAASRGDCVSWPSSPSRSRSSGALRPPTFEPEARSGWRHANSGCFRDE
jgi:regulator of nucleoside diphosphate kinase